jgi:hypothetical protein
MESLRVLRFLLKRSRLWMLRLRESGLSINVEILIVLNMQDFFTLLVLEDFLDVFP